MDIREFLSLAFKHKWKILITFITVATVVVVETLMSSPVYEAKTTIMIKPWKEVDSRVEIGGSNNNSNVSLTQEELVNTEIQILTGRELAEKVITTLKLERMYPGTVGKERKGNPMDAAVETFAADLKVAGIRKSNVITVTFQHGDPALAARALNLLVDVFKEKHLALHSNPESSFIGTQLTSFENKLKASEKDLQQFQQANGVFSLEEQRSLLLRQRTELDTSYKLASNNVSELRNKIASIKGQLKYISKNNSRYTPTDRDKIVIDAKSRLLEMQLKEQDLRRKYTENNRLVVNAKKEIELVNQFLKEQEENIVGKVKTSNPVYQNMELDLFRAEGDMTSQLARSEAVRNQLRLLDKEIAQLDSNENKIQNLKREIAINEKNFKTYADRNEEARISEALNRLKLSNISVIQAAAIPADPVKSNKILKMVVGLLVGLFSGFAFAYVLEAFSPTFSDPESVEKYLDLPVLLTVPHKEV